MDNNNVAMPGGQPVGYPAAPTESGQDLGAPGMAQPGQYPQVPGQPGAGQIPQIPGQPGQPFRTPTIGVKKKPKNQGAKKGLNVNVIKWVIIGFLGVLVLVLGILLIWMNNQLTDATMDVQGQIDKAVSKATYDLETRLQNEFDEKEKYPFKTFAGPSDFGSLTFEYPKTWSVYIPDDASDASNFKAYLNPDHVARVSDKTVMALRVSILNTLMDKVLEDYNDRVEDGKMTLSTTVVNGANVNLYKGLLKSDYYGIVCVFKIRDKTGVIQTDAYAFEDDFNSVLKTVRFNV